MDKKYYIEIESLRSGKYYRDEHSSNSPTFQEITDAYLWSTKDYSDYFWKKASQLSIKLLAKKSQNITTQ